MKKIVKKVNIIFSNEEDESLFLMAQPLETLSKLKNTQIEYDNFEGAGKIRDIIKERLI